MRNMAVLHSPAFSYPLPVLVRVLFNLLIFKGKILYYNKYSEKAFLDKSAKVYYTGKKFPTTVALNKLFYFMPYIKGKGVKDLWLIKVARLGFRKEGTPLEDKNDLRLVFEIEYVSPIFDDYQSVELKIWRTFTDSTIYELLKTNKKKN